MGQEKGQVVDRGVRVAYGDESSEVTGARERAGLEVRDRSTGIGKDGGVTFLN